jgi:hypothetical protein
VHVLLAVTFTACVLPPPLTVDTSDGGVNAPPAITSVIDPSGTARRPPDTITLAVLSDEEIRVTVDDRDLDDDLVLQLFVDYEADPVDAAVNCTAPQTEPKTTSRVGNCTTNGLCADGDEGGHTLEIEAYDRPPDPNFPYREPGDGGYFSTWTFHLECIPQT